MFVLYTLLSNIIILFIIYCIKHVVTRSSNIKCARDCIDLQRTLHTECNTRPNVESPVENFTAKYDAYENAFKHAQRPRMENNVLPLETNTDTNVFNSGTVNDPNKDDQEGNTTTPLKMFELRTGLDNTSDVETSTTFESNNQDFAKTVPFALSKAQDLIVNCLSKKSNPIDVLKNTQLSGNNLTNLVLEICKPLTQVGNTVTINEQDNNVNKDLTDLVKSIQLNHITSGEYTSTHMSNSAKPE